MFKKGDRVRRFTNFGSSLNEYFEGEPFYVVESHPSHVVDPKGQNHAHQYLELAPEGPVRTVTRQEIIPGTYDGVVVGNVGVSGVQVAVRIDDGFYDADTLTRAAAVLTALAGALRDE